jgi:hypothetical protein
MPRADRRISQSRVCGFARLVFEFGHPALKKLATTRGRRGGAIELPRAYQSESVRRIRTPGFQKKPLRNVGLRLERASIKRRRACYRFAGCWCCTTAQFQPQGASTCDVSSLQFIENAPSLVVMREIEEQLGAKHACAVGIAKARRNRQRGHCCAEPALFRIPANRVERRTRTPVDTVRGSQRGRIPRAGMDHGHEEPT